MNMFEVLATINQTLCTLHNLQILIVQFYVLIRESKKECKRLLNFHIEIVHISGFYEVLECSLCRHDN